MRAIINITVSYETEPAEIQEAVHTVSERMVAQMPYLFLLDDKQQAVEPPQLYGITDVKNSALGAKYTVVSLVRDEHYWTACKVIRKELLQEMKHRGIQISYPRLLGSAEFYEGRASQTTP